MMEGFKILGCTLLGTAALMGSIIAIANWGSSVSCRQSAELMGLESRYSFNTTCFVKIDGLWEPLSWQRSVRIKP